MNKAFVWSVIKEKKKKRPYFQMTSGQKCMQ